MTTGQEPNAYIQAPGPEQRLVTDPEVKRVLKYLKAIDVARSVSLAAAAAAAGVAVVSTSPISFPAVTAGAALVVGLGELLARRERKQLDSRLEQLKAEHNLNSANERDISSTANTITVAGSST
jgi:hypothetical protein